MVLLGWTGVVSGALATGAAIAGILVLPRRQELLAMALALGGAMATILSIGILTTEAGHPAITGFAAIVALAASGGGFALVAALLPSLVTPGRSADPLPATAAGRILVILLADAEPEVYEPADVTRQLAALTAAGLSEPSMAVLPFYYASHKARYRAVGSTSPEQGQTRALAELVASRLDRSRFAGPVPVFCENDILLAEVIAEASASGFEKVVTMTPYVAEPLRVDRAKRRLDAARLDPGTLTVAHAASLCGSERIAAQVAEMVGKLAGEPASAGVALVVHGQPGDQGHDYPAFEAEENAFANRVRMAVAEGGIPEESVRLCWDAWKEPGVTETVRHLVALGSDPVLVVPVAYPFENLDTLLEIPAAIKQVRAPEDVHIVQLPAWRDDPRVAEEIVCAIESAALEL